MAKDTSMFPTSTPESFVPGGSAKEDTFARAQLIRVLGSDFDVPVEFKCPEGEGRKIIQRMQVRLSKLRDKASRAGKTVEVFKMRTQEITSQDGGLEQVVLVKTKTIGTDIAKALDSLDNEFPGLITGSKWMGGSK